MVVVHAYHPGTLEAEARGAHHMFEAVTDYLTSSRTGKATETNPVEKEQSQDKMLDRRLRLRR